MSDSNRTTLCFAPEATYNTDPTASATWVGLRTLSDSLKQDISLSSSDEIRSYRDIPALDQTDRAVSGSINQNLYFDNNGTGELMQFGIGSADWGDSGADTSVVAAAACSITQSSRTIAKDSGSWANNPAVGEWVYISGAANSATNGYHQVATVSGSNSFTVNSAVGGNESGVTLTAVTMSQITNGTTTQNLHIQRNYSDLSNQSELFGGMNVAGWSVDATGQDTVSFNTEWIGAQATSLASTARAIDTAAATNAAMTTTNGVQWVREGTGAGSVADLACTGFSFTVDNGIRKQYELGTFGPSALKLGDFTVTGTLQAYFTSNTLFDKFLNQTATGLSIAISDEAATKGNAFIFDFPSVKFTDGSRVAGGRNQDIIADLTWQAIYDGSSHTMKIARTASS